MYLIASILIVALVLIAANFIRQWYQIEGFYAIMCCICTLLGVVVVYFMLKMLSIFG